MGCAASQELREQLVQRDEEIDLVRADTAGTPWLTLSNHHLSDLTACNRLL